MTDIPVPEDLQALIDEEVEALRAEGFTNAEAWVENPAPGVWLTTVEVSVIDTKVGFVIVHGEGINYGPHLRRWLITEHVVPDIRAKVARSN